MHRIAIILTTITLAITACSLSTVPQESAQVEPIDLTAIAALTTPTPQAENTPDPSSQPASSAPADLGLLSVEDDDTDDAAAQSQSSATVAVNSSPPSAQAAADTTGDTGCTRRDDWTVTYTVVPGDTLTEIATRAGVSTAELAVANCIDNANNIAEGQRLRVPSAVRDEIPLNTGSSTIPQGGGGNASLAAATGGGASQPCDTGFQHYFTTNFDANSNGWCAGSAPSNVQAMIQRFENGYMLAWQGQVYVLRRGGSDGGLVEVYPDTAGGQNDIAFDEAPSGLFKPVGAFAKTQLDYSNVRTTMGWGVAPAQVFTMRVQNVTIPNATTSVMQWGPRMFVNWPLDNRVIALGNRTWTVAGTGSAVPVGVAVSNNANQTAFDQPPGGGGGNEANRVSASVGRVYMEPYTSYDGETFYMESNAIVTVSLHNADLSNAQRVEFFYDYDLTGIFPDNTQPTGRVLIGSDENFADGATASWHLPGGVRGKVSANITYRSGEERVTSAVSVWAEIYQ